MEGLLTAFYLFHTRTHPNTTHRALAQVARMAPPFAVLPLVGPPHRGATHHAAAHQMHVDAWRACSTPLCMILEEDVRFVNPGRLVPTLARMLRERRLFDMLVLSHDVGTKDLARMGVSDRRATLQKSVSPPRLSFAALRVRRSESAASTERSTGSPASQEAVSRSRPATGPRTILPKKPHPRGRPRASVRRPATPACGPLARARAWSQATSERRGDIRMQNPVDRARSQPPTPTPSRGDFRAGTRFRATTGVRRRGATASARPPLAARRVRQSESAAPAERLNSTRGAESPVLNSDTEHRQRARLAFCVRNRTSRKAHSDALRTW